MKRLLLTLLFASPANAEDILVAVAANFTEPAKEIAAAFEIETGHTATPTFASTGTHYTQIAQNAPYAVFLAADQARPEMLEIEGLAVPGTRFTYATGKIVLWSADPDLISDDTALANPEIAHIAITNPLTAPYGAAAVEAIKALGHLDSAEPRFVQGKSLTQTYQFIATGSAEIGVIALSQLAGKETGSHWVFPETLYTLIRQDAVLLKQGETSEAAQAFLAFLQSAKAREIIARYGYGF